MDKQTFTEQLIAIETSLYAVARTFFPSPHDCGDAVQEATLKAWRGLHLLRDKALFKPWITRILINQCHTMCRQRNRVTLVETIPEAPGPTEDPLLYEGVMALDIRYRLPFVLHYVEGYKTREIGQMLHLPKGTVLSRLSKARAMLKETIQLEEVPRHET